MKQTSITNQKLLAYKREAFASFGDWGSTRARVFRRHLYQWVGWWTRHDVTWILQNQLSDKATQIYVFQWNHWSSHSNSERSTGLARQYHFHLPLAVPPVCKQLLRIRDTGRTTRMQALRPLRQPLLIDGRQRTIVDPERMCGNYPQRSGISGLGPYRMLLPRPPGLSRILARSGGITSHQDIHSTQCAQQGQPGDCPDSCIAQSLWKENKPATLSHLHKYIMYSIESMRMQSVLLYYY